MFKITMFQTGFEFWSFEFWYCFEIRASDFESIINMEVAILSGVNSKFGELWETSPRDLVRDVALQAISEAGIKPSEIDAIFVGNMLSGMLAQQEHLGAFFAEELGLPVSAIRVEGACASGGLAVHLGVCAISSGMYRNVLIVGVEKMTDYKPEEVAHALMGAGSDVEREAGATFPALYALMAQVHMTRFGTTSEQLAWVAVKNHYHATLSENAQFPFAVSVEQVLKSSMVAYPLHLLDCSPITDGASAVVLSINSKHQIPNSKTVNIIASAVATDTLGLAQRKDLTTIDAAVRAGKMAYEQAGIGPSDIDVCEVHDCFTIAEVLAMEDLGFFKKGEAGEKIAAGVTTLGKGKKLIVNTSGGLKAAGHPVGATGVKQIVEVFHQLAGSAGKKQVEGARLGLAHNVGGSGATAVVHILKSLK